MAAVCHSFQLAKDCGFKVVTHMMPDLPNMGFERDLEGFREFFDNPLFRPDGLKLYPTLVRALWALDDADCALVGAVDAHVL